MKRVLKIQPGSAIAMVALFVALSGTAVALPGSNTVNSGDIRNNAVRSADLRNNDVRTQDIRNGTVGGADIATGAVGGADIATGAVGARALANGSVDASKLAPGTIPPRGIQSIRFVQGDLVGVPGSGTNGGRADAFAQCGAGEQLVGGGFAQPGNVNQQAVVLNNGPDANLSTRWFVRVKNFDPAGVVLQAYAYCAS
jgi:hypothetical protein